MQKVALISETEDNIFVNHLLGIADSAKIGRIPDLQKTKKRCQAEVIGIGKKTLMKNLES
jgi:hypothetical protein